MPMIRSPGDEAEVFSSLCRQFDSARGPHRTMHSQTLAASDVERIKSGAKCPDGNDMNSVLSPIRNPGARDHRKHPWLTND